MPVKVKYISLDEAVQVVNTTNFDISIGAVYDAESARQAATEIYNAIAADINARLRLLDAVEIERAEA